MFECVQAGFSLPWAGSRHLLVHTQTFMDGTTTYSCDTLVAGLILRSTPIDWWCLYWIHGDTDPSIYTGTSSLGPGPPYDSRNGHVQLPNCGNPLSHH